MSASRTLGQVLLGGLGVVTLAVAVVLVAFLTPLQTESARAVAIQLFVPALVASLGVTLLAVAASASKD